MSSVAGGALDFTYEALPMRVTFGVGRVAALADELDALGLRRVLVLATPEQEETARALAAPLGDRCVGVLPEAAMHVPREVAERGRDAARDLGADGCLAVGGGSTIGLGKAIALVSGLPIVAVPTTYAGSEMTPVWGLSEGGRKTTGRDRKVLPRSVVYDPELTLSLPVGLSVTSGVNAIAHAVEALYAPDGSPIVSLMARDGARALYAALPRVVADPAAVDARSEALYGAWLCGACLGATTMSLHHKLCHVLGGRGLPHAETHTVVLPYAIAFNAAAAPSLVPALRSAWEVADPARAVQDLAGRLGAPTSLRALGLSRDDLPGIVAEAVANPYANPRPVTAEAVAALLDDAWNGRPVGIDA